MPKTIHGMYGTRVYAAWANMKYRCYNLRCKGYANYGGRGIIVCDQWHKFLNFYVDMGDPPSLEHSIDRIDNDGNYEPGNCRWATFKQQNNNKRTNRYLEHDQQKRTKAEWARSLGISRHVLHQRLSRGWSVERALTEPIRGHRPE